MTIIQSVQLIMAPAIVALILTGGRAPACCPGLIRPLGKETAVTLCANTLPACIRLFKLCIEVPLGDCDLVQYESIAAYYQQRQK
jgi:hypothetical protein